MSIPYDRGLSVPSDVLLQELDGESVILNLETTRYFGLDQVGTRILDLLNESPTIQEAYDSLMEEYEVEPEVLTKELNALIEALLEKGIVTLDGP